MPLKGKWFLDIGFGQGLSLLLAATHGALVVGNDINPKCRLALETSRRFFPSVAPGAITIVEGSILDPAVKQRLVALAPEGCYDIVYAWGVLHHTGAMWQALDIVLSLVKPGGWLVLAIYNKHWTSPYWRVIKRLFNLLPVFGQRLLASLAFLPALLVTWLTTRTNPFSKERGMSFYYDLIDWLGGYPYEFASPEEISRYLKQRADLHKLIPVVGNTGCNQFVAQLTAAGPPQEEEQKSRR